MSYWHRVCLALLMIFLLSGSTVVKSQPESDGQSKRLKEILGIIDDHYLISVDICECSRVILEKGISACTDEYTWILSSGEAKDWVKQMPKDGLRFKSLPNRVGYVSIPTFGYADLPNSLLQTVEFLTAFLGSEVIILDLRNNGGGYIEAAFAGLSLFASSPDTIIVYHKARSRDEKIYEFFNRSTIEIVPKSLRGRFSKLKVVLLVNEITASAAEIFAGWFKEEFGAPVVGQTTFGKGIAQFPFNLSDGSILHMTTSEFFIGSRSVKLHGVGVEPTVSVSEPTLQLKKAIEIAEDLLKN